MLKGRVGVRARDLFIYLFFTCLGFLIFEIAFGQNLISGLRLRLNLGCMARGMIGASWVVRIR